MLQKIPVAIKVYCGSHIIFFGFILHCIDESRYKLEITSPSLSDLQKNKYQINFYESPKDKGKFYVCWPKFISSLDLAINVLKIWSATVTYTVLYNKDSRNFFVNKKLLKGNFTKSFKLFRKKYGITTEVLTPDLVSKN